MYKKRNKIEFPPPHPKKVLYMNFEATRLRGRPRNRRKEEMRENRRLLGGRGWKERLYNKEEWKKLPEKCKESSHSARANGKKE
jgi:hypothetical protein